MFGSSKLTNSFYQVLLMQVLFFSSNALFESIQGNVSLPLATYCEDVIVSNDGSILACTHYLDKSVEVFSNTGTTFSLTQVIDLELYPNNLFMSEDGRKIYATGNDKLKIFEGTNGSYQLAESITVSSTTYDADISKDESLLVVSYLNGSIEIFEKNGTTYVLRQAIGDSSTLTDIILSEDKN